MARYLLVALLALACLAPATANAEVSDFGSDLSSPANIDQNHGADTSYWNLGLPNGGRQLAPADGQVTVVKLKGGVLPNDRLRRTEAENLAKLIHFQVLRPREDGRYKVVELSTGHLDIPVTDSQDVVTRYEPVNLCVKAGDLVAFNTIGAHEYRRDANHQGAQYQVFSRVPDATMQWYTHDNGLNEKATINPFAVPLKPGDPEGGTSQGLELLMRTTLATGPDATDICPGGFAQHIYRGMEFNKPTQPTVKTKDRVVRLKGFCHGENYGGCFGKVTLTATLDGVDTVLGEAKVSIKNAFTDTIEVPLSPEILLKLQVAKKVTATATADTNDNPRSDNRVRWDSVPVQQKTTTDQVVLTPDRPACVVPKVTGKSLSVAKRTLKKAGCGVGKIKRKKAPASKRGKVTSQSVAAKLVLPSLTPVGLTVGTK